jgi:hypothetical protein
VQIIVAAGAVPNTGVTAPFFGRSVRVVGQQNSGDTFGPHDKKCHFADPATSA